MDGQDSPPSPKPRKSRCGIQCHQDSEPLEAWLLLIRIMLYNALTGINFSCFGVLYVEYTEYFRSSKSEIGWVVSIQGATINILGIFVSKPLEQFGCSRVAFVGSVLGSVGLALSALAPNVPVLYATQGVIAGIGFCIAALPSPVILQQHFSANRIFANGMGHLGYSIGHIIGPPLTQFLFEGFGWRGCILLLAGIMANRAPLGLTFWAHRKQKKPDQSSTGCFSNIIDFSLFRDKRFLFFCIGSMLQKFYTISYVNHLPSYVVYLGYSLDNAAFLTSFVFFLNTTTKLLVAFVSNMKGVNHLMQFSIGTFIGTFSIFVLFIYGYTALILSAFATGLHLGVTLTITWVILVDLLGVEVIARSLGLYNFLVGIISLICTPLCGFLYDVTNYYESAFIVMGIMVTSAGVIFSVLAVHVGRSNKSKEVEDEECEVVAELHGSQLSIAI